MSREDILNDIFEFLKSGKPLHFSNNPLNANPHFVRDKQHFYDALSDSDLVDNIPGSYGDWHYHFKLNDFGKSQLRNKKYSEYYSETAKEKARKEKIETIKEKNVKAEYWPKKLWWLIPIAIIILGVAAALIGEVLKRRIWPPSTQSQQPSEPSLDTSSAPQQILPFVPDSASGNKDTTGKGNVK